MCSDPEAHKASNPSIASESRKTPCPSAITFSPRGGEEGRPATHPQHSTAT